MPKPATVKPISLASTLSGLRYIANSPPRKWGGFHPEAVKIAKGALWHLKRKART